MAFKTADKGGNCPMCGQMMPAQQQAPEKESPMEMRAEGEAPSKFSQLAGKMYPQSEALETARKAALEAKRGKAAPKNQ